MKQRILILLVASACLLAPSVRADLAGASFGGYYTHISSDEAGSGNGGGAIVRAQLAGILAADARIGYVDFAENDLSAIPAEVTLLARAPVPFFAVYGGAGAGAWFFESGEKDYDNGYGWYPLVGAEFKISELVLFAEARYLFLKADYDDGETDLNGPGFNLGLSFRW